MDLALEGGVWLHGHRLRDGPMVHLVSADKDRLLALGADLGMRPEWLQYKPLKDPRTGERVPAWHWDLWGSRLRELDGGGHAGAPRRGVDVRDEGRARRPRHSPLRSSGRLCPPSPPSARPPRSSLGA